MASVQQEYMQGHLLQMQMQPIQQVHKIPKDPNKPKKKKSPFDVFRNEQIHEFKRLHPETKVDLGGELC